jgi:hypothetical protein
MFDDDYKRLSDHYGPKRIRNLSERCHLSQADPSTIPFMGGRPQRDIIITSGEIMDLTIALETDTIEQFNVRYGMSIA